jgi:hypothetical protein
LLWLGAVVLLMLIRLAGAMVWAHPKTLSRASGVVLLAAVVAAVVVGWVLLLFALDLSHEGSRAETRCMAGSSGAAALVHQSHELTATAVMCRRG